MRHLVILAAFFVYMSSVQAAEARVSLLLRDAGDGVLSVRVQNAGPKSLFYRSTSMFSVEVLDGDEWKAAPLAAYCGNCLIDMPLTELPARTSVTEYVTVPDSFRAHAEKKIRVRMAGTVSNEVAFVWHPPRPNPFLHAFPKKG